MAQIVINEISQNYSYNIGTNSYATVAFPITACWGPGYFDPEKEYSGQGNAGVEKMLEHTVWQRFPATQAGLDSFVATYRGAAANYRLAQDFSYQMAVTLLTAGYDVLVCRMCPGNHADGSFVQHQADDATATVSIRAKYPGTFGNNLQININKVTYFDRTARANKYYWNIITYVIDASGVKSAVESKTLVFNVENANDSILYYKEVESNFWEITKIEGTILEDAATIADLVDPTDATKKYVQLTHGTDYDDTVAITSISLEALAKSRFDWASAYQSESDEYKYPSAIRDALDRYTYDDTTKHILYYREWLYTHAVGFNLPGSDGQPIGGVYDLLKDKLSYNPNRVISPGWDDQDIYAYTDDQDVINSWFGLTGATDCKIPPSPLNLKLMDVAYYSRCATAYIDTPHIVDRRFVHIEDESNPDREGYIQELARVTPSNAALDVNGTLFHTHSAFFAPWGQFPYVGTSKMNVASPSFLALMIQRAQILNQSIQYEWALPTNRKHNLRIGKMEYTVPKKVLDKWQKLEGASVNVITEIPDLGTNIWGNSTLYEVPPATYQALANLSTRFLVNAVEDVAYRCGIGITFQYNNGQAYNKFYAGVTPLLDTMRNVGAIDDYRVEMSADINGEDHVNANTVIGKIWLIVNGVINDIYVDLIALPAGLGIDLNSLS